MRKRLAIVGHSEEGLALIPLLEANPDVEIHAILTQDPGAAMRVLTRVEPEIADQFADRLTSDSEAVIRTQGLVAMIDAEAPDALREILADAPDRGIQVTTPLIARLLYAFGPIDASRKPDLLQTLSEILGSYNLTIDRYGLLSRILQIAVGATGADRGSLMLFDDETRLLTVEVAIGIEKELIPKIRVRPGEGIAGRAFEERTTIRVDGKADHDRYDIVRERDDVGSAISAPLLHDDRALGVLNLSHSRQHGAFTEEDVEFVDHLARIDAKIITRAEEYHTLRRDSARLRAQSEVREILTSAGPLADRLQRLCRFVAEETHDGICHLYLRDPELGTIAMTASSTQLDPLGAPLRISPGEGVHGWVAEHRQPIIMGSSGAGSTGDGPRGCSAVLPLTSEDRLLGVLSIETVVVEPAPDLLHDKIRAITQSLSQELADALREARIEREAMKMAAIAEATAPMHAAVDAAELHRSISTSAAIILEAEHAVLRLQDMPTGRYQIRSYFGAAETDAQESLFAMEKELSIASIQARAALRVVDLDQRPELAAFDTGIESALCYPLARDGRVFGTLSVLGKAARDLLASDRFSEADETALARFADQVQQVLEQQQLRESAHKLRRFDELTGLPNAVHVRERLDQELARAAQTGRSVLLVRVHVRELAAVLDELPETDADTLVMSLAQELRGGVRDFDVLGRTAPDTFQIVVPEPTGEASELVGPLARRLRDALRREPTPGLAERLQLEFGYAVYPTEAGTARALLDRIEAPRIISD